MREGKLLTLGRVAIVVIIALLINSNANLKGANARYQQEIHSLKEQLATAIEQGGGNRPVCKGDNP